jgi:hypothetical protein
MLRRLPVIAALSISLMLAAAAPAAATSSGSSWCTTGHTACAISGSFKPSLPGRALSVSGSLSAKSATVFTVAESLSITPATGFAGGKTSFQIVMLPAGSDLLPGCGLPADAVQMAPAGTAVTSAAGTASRTVSAPYTALSAGTRAAFITDTRAAIASGATFFVVAKASGKTAGSPRLTACAEIYPRF